MFYVFIERLYKINTGNTEKFAPRTTNHKQYTISGPFSSRKLAERVAANALGTHTCLSAMVGTADEVKAYAGKQTGYIANDVVRKLLG